MSKAVCSIECCPATAWARGWCNKHYGRWRKHGDVNVVLVSATVYKPGQQHENRRTLFGLEHPNWKGDNAGYAAVHARLKVRRGAASAHVCVDCGGCAAEWSYSHADPAEHLGWAAKNGNSIRVPYSTSVEFYDPRCKTCHTVFDQGATSRG